VILPIVAGMLDGNDPAVVAVAHRPIACEDAPAVTCSGVLVAPRVVLTAAHCVEGMGSRGVLEVVFGPSAAQRTSEIIVQSFQVYSGYDASTGDGDLAVLLLAEDAPVAPIARPTATSIRSPAACPHVSFTTLKWSRSIMRMPTRSPARRRRPMLVTCSSKRRRFGSPVSGSVRARVSASLRE